MAWDKRQVKDFVKAAKDSMGGAWRSPLFTDEMREAILARQFAGVITGQGVDTLKTEDIDKLWRDMLVEAGLVEK